MRRRSRLSQRAEKQTKRTFIVSVLGSILLLIAIVKYGIPLLVNISVFLSGSRDAQEVVKKDSAGFVASPLLNETFTATNSAEISVTGTGSKDQTISLYVNDQMVEKTKVEKDGTFRFDDISLKEGENTIKARATTSDNKKSDYSNQLTVVFKKNPPSLSIDSPSSGQSYNKDGNQAIVRGKTDPGVKVTINGFFAIVDSEGKFTYTLPLQNGDNHIKIIATDQAGNTTENERTVTYSP